MQQQRNPGEDVIYPTLDRARSGREAVIAETHNLPSTPHHGGQRVILAAISNHSSRTQWSFTLLTRQAPTLLTRRAACSLQAKTLLAAGAHGSSGLALFSRASGSAWQASLLKTTGLLHTSSRPCDTNSLSKLDSKSTRIAAITVPYRRQSPTDRFGPASPIPCYAFGFDNRRNEFRNVEKFSGRGALFGAKACSTYKRCTTK